MARFARMIAPLLLLTASASAQEPVDAQKARIELLAAKAALEAETQKASALQKLADAQRVLNAELQKQIEEMKKALEGGLKDRENREKLQQKQTETLEKLERAIAAEAEQLKRLAREREVQLVRLKEENEDLKKRLTEEKARGKSQQDRGDRLLEQLERINRELLGMRKFDETTPTIVKKPYEPVRGKVKEIDESGLVSIDVGADAGLKDGDILEVFRLTPDDPKASAYLGQLKVVKTADKESVGRFTAAGREKMPRLGDEVASKLVQK